MVLSRSDNDKTMKRYQHRPIDPCSNIIRLLKIQPDRCDDVIRCELIYTTLSESPDYLALSYMWGHEQRERDILVDGQLYGVRANLWAFLQQSQETLPGAIFWIDALCINQKSNKERGHQVQLMGAIYSKATKVIVWLGNDGVSISYLFWLFGNADGDLKHLTRTEAQQHLRTAYMLTQFPYWSRIWIIQELLLASHVELMYNDDLLSWDCLWTGIDALIHISGQNHTLATQSYDITHSHASLKHFGGEGQTAGTQSYGITHSYAYRHHIQRDFQQQLPRGQKSTDLNGLLARYSASQSSLLRDRLVGLLSLMENGHTFKDSYEGTMANLVLRAFLHFRGNLEALGRLRQALRVPHHHLYEELASWQPSRISSSCENPRSYRGEMVRFETSSEYVQSREDLLCTKCGLSVGEPLSEVYPSMTLFCLAGMGTSRHMVTVANLSDTGRLDSYVVFFDKFANRGNEISAETKFTSKSEGLMAIYKRPSGNFWLYFSIDLFLYLAEHLRLPEVAYKSPMAPERTMAPVPRSAEGLGSLLEGNYFADDPIGRGDLTPVTFDLLVPSDGGRTLVEWLEFRTVRQAYRDFAERSLEANNESPNTQGLIVGQAASGS